MSTLTNNTTNLQNIFAMVNDLPLGEVKTNATVSISGVPLGTVAYYEYEEESLTPKQVNPLGTASSININAAVGESILISAVVYNLLAATCGGGIGNILLCEDGYTMLARVISQNDATIQLYDDD